MPKHAESRHLLRPTRRDVCRWGLAGLAAAGLPALACQRRTPYNVLMIVIDDLSNWTGCLGGHPDALTPNIDALAASGRLFRRAYAPGTNCNGSRTAVLTGMRPWTTGVYIVGNPFAPELVGRSLPVAFRNGGYTTRAAGKVFHEPQRGAWDELYVPDAPDLSQHLVPGEYNSGFEEGSRIQWGPVKFPDSKMWDGKLAAWAERHLSAGHEKPFFLSVGFFQPHMPWWVPRRYFRPFRPQKITLPEIDPRDLQDIPRFARMRAFRGDFKQIVERGQWPYAVASYLAAMYFIDAMVGRVLAALDAGPHAEDTIVALWSDHGFSLGQKLNWRKFLLWEHQTQVPFIVRVPGMAEAGVATSRTVDLMDLYPTLVDLCGVPRPDHLEGRSLVPLLRHPEAEWPWPAVSTAGWGSHATRTERWRYIRYGDGTEELYDHDTDPLERTNLADLPENASLKEDLARWLPADPTAAGDGA